MEIITYTIAVAIVAFVIYNLYIEFVQGDK